MAKAPTVAKSISVMREYEPIMPLDSGPETGFFEVGEIEAEAEGVLPIGTEPEVKVVPVDDYFYENISSDKIYRLEVGEIPELDEHELSSLLEMAAAGDPEAKDRVIKANLRLVMSIAGHYVGRGLDYADLVQSGNEGLMEAADRFNPKKGFVFSTFATYCIRGYINRAIDEQGSTIRVPVHVSQEYRTLRKTYSTLVQDLGRDPTDEELAEKMDMSPKKISGIVASRNLTLPIDNNIGGDDEAPTFAEITPDKNMPVDEQALINSDVELLINIVNRLPERERTLMELRYLIGQNAVGMNRTEKEVGEIMGLSRDAVSNLARKALYKIKSRMGDKLSASY